MKYRRIRKQGNRVIIFTVIAAMIFSFIPGVLWDSLAENVVETTENVEVQEKDAISSNNLEIVEEDKGSGNETEALEDDTSVEPSSNAEDENKEEGLTDSKTSNKSEETDDNGAVSNAIDDDRAINKHEESKKYTLSPQNPISISLKGYIKDQPVPVKIPAKSEMEVNLDDGKKLNLSACKEDRAADGSPMWTIESDVELEVGTEYTGQASSQDFFLKKRLENLILIGKIISQSLN